MTFRFTKCDFDGSGVDLDVEAQLGEIDGAPVIGKYTTGGELYHASVEWHGVTLSGDGIERMEMEWGELRRVSVDGMLLPVLMPVVDQFAALVQRYRMVSIPPAIAARLEANRANAQAERYQGKIGPRRNYRIHYAHDYTGVALN